MRSAQAEALRVVRLLVRPRRVARLKGLRGQRRLTLQLAQGLPRPERPRGRLRPPKSKPVNLRVGRPPLHQPSWERVGLHLPVRLRRAPRRGTVVAALHR